MGEIFRTEMSDQVLSNCFLGRCAIPTVTGTSASGTKVTRRLDAVSIVSGGAAVSMIFAVGPLQDKNQPLPTVPALVAQQKVMIGNHHLKSKEYSGPNHNDENWKSEVIRVETCNQAQRSLYNFPLVFA